MLTQLLDSRAREDEPTISRRVRGLAEAWRLSGRRLAEGPVVDQISLWLTLSAFLVAIGAALIAPYLAFTWLNQPFPGFVVEQTGVIADQDGLHWSGRGAGLGYPERVTAIDGQPVNNPTEMQAALEGSGVGQLIEVETSAPDGQIRHYRNIAIRPFPRADLDRMFWLPYGAGIAFLLLGTWVFLIRGETRPGRAFAFFCISGSSTIILLFDLITTHVMSTLWTVAVALVGGSLFSLAALFPQELSPVQRRPWIRLLPYLGSLALATWGLIVLRDTSRPWAYIDAWGYSYRYMAAGILAFLVMMILRLRSDLTPVARQQARTILWGSLLAFIPLSVWLAAPLFGVYIPWNAGVFLPLLMLFPVSIAFAILRYRMWDIDVIINRTLVYSTLTLLLGLIYVGSVLIFQGMFRPVIRNDWMAAAVSTLSIVALFNPLRQRVQIFIDARFYRHKYDMAKTLAAFGATLRDEVDLTRLIGRLEQVIWETMHPASIYTWLAGSAGYSVHLAGVRRLPGGQDSLEVSLEDSLLPTLRYITGALELERMENQGSPAYRALIEAGIKLLLPLISQGELIGWIGLGRRLSDRDYSTDDRSLLANLAAQAAPAVRVAQLVRKEQARTLERERFEHELRLARTIQLALLPKGLPKLEDWQVAAHYQPARAVGGDFYDFIPLEDGRIGIVIGDVTGKGVPAALVMATTLSILRAVALQGFSPGQLLRQVNNQLEMDIPDQMFITCLYAILDLKEGRLIYANAGHNLPFRRSFNGVEELRARGMPLGLMPDMDYEEKETILEIGDSLLMYSDGLVEAHSPAHAMFGTQRLRELVALAGGREMALIQRSLEELSAFTSESWEQEDDITMVLLYRSA